MSMVPIHGGIKDALKIIEKIPGEIERIKSDVKKAGLAEEAVSVIQYRLNLFYGFPS